MKLYIEIIKLLFNGVVLKKNKGILIRDFATKMGIVYIKMAQMLATQNFGNLFTEDDREMLKGICDDCDKIPYTEIEKVLKEEYGENLDNIFDFIDKESVGSASVSQVHRGILKTGEEVAIKVKRRDVTEKIEEDIKRIRKIVHRFGKFVGFKNSTGGDHALDLYLEWILQEIDFKHEVENIKLYESFANDVNGKVRNTKKIKVPKLYEEYCTDNVIVMEFIKTPTINEMELTDENKDKIITAFNSYVKSSFFALFNGKIIVFHGDPHSGNIAIDEDGNICFLDMGLVFDLDYNDAELIRKFFLTAHSGNYEKLYDMIIPYSNMNNKEKKLFMNDCKKFCSEIKYKEVTFYFVDILNICLKYKIDPPNFLFCMAKAFVCLNGISKFSNNKYTAKELLDEQVIEFMIKRSFNDCKNTIKSLDSPKVIVKNTLKYGIINTAVKELSSSDVRKNFIKLLENIKEMGEITKSYYQGINNELTEERGKTYSNINTQ